MKRTIVPVALLATFLSLSCSRTGVMPDPTTNFSAQAGARQTFSVMPLPTSVLPASVKSYLDQNQSGYTLIQVEKLARPGSSTYTGTKVKILRNGQLADLFFDQNGALATQPAGPGGEVATSLTTAQLPSAVSTYLSQTYAGYQLVTAESVQLNGTVQEYRTQILVNNQRIDVHFDSKGAFRDAHTAPDPTATSHSITFVAKSALPTAITTVLASSTYSAYTYGWTELHVHDGVTTYDVKLFSNNQPNTLHFDASGNLAAPMAPGMGKPMSGTTTGGPTPPASGTATGMPTPPKSGTATGVPTPPTSGTMTGGPTPPKSGTATGMPTPPASGTMTPGMATNHQLILDGTKLPSAITSYLQANFSGYTFLAADQDTGTGGAYTMDIAVGQQLYKLRFSAAGELLMAEARI